MIYDAGVYISVGIGKESKEKCNAIIKQILENQEKLEKIKNEFKSIGEYEGYPEDAIKICGGIEYILGDES